MIQVEWMGFRKDYLYLKELLLDYGLNIYEIKNIIHLIKHRSLFISNFGLKMIVLDENEFKKQVKWLMKDFEYLISMLVLKNKNHEDRLELSKCKEILLEYIKEIENE